MSKQSFDSDSAYEDSGYETKQSRVQLMVSSNRVSKLTIDYYSLRDISSVASSITEYRYENGRRYHSYHEGRM